MSVSVFGGETFLGIPVGGNKGQGIWGSFSSLGSISGFLEDIERAARRGWGVLKTRNFPKALKHLLLMTQWITSFLFPFPLGPSEP